jgi:hypothetical protein
VDVERGGDAELGDLRLLLILRPVRERNMPRSSKDAETVKSSADDSLESACAVCG